MSRISFEGMERWRPPCLRRRGEGGTGGEAHRERPRRPAATASALRRGSERRGGLRGGTAGRADPGGRQRRRAHRGWNRLLADGSGGVRPDSAETPTGGAGLGVRAERRRCHPAVRKGGMELWDIVLTT